jgi:hypothetical protein
VQCLNRTALARTEAQISAFAQVALWVMAGLGGAFIPTWVMGEFLGNIGKMVPKYWAIQAYTDVMIRWQGLAEIGTDGSGLVEVLPNPHPLWLRRRLFLGRHVAFHVRIVYTWVNPPPVVKGGGTESVEGTEGGNLRAGTRDEKVCLRNGRYQSSSEGGDK